MFQSHTCTIVQNMNLKQFYEKLNAWIYYCFSNNQDILSLLHMGIWDAYVASEQFFLLASKIASSICLACKLEQVIKFPLYNTIQKVKIQWILIEWCNRYIFLPLLGFEPASSGTKVQHSTDRPKGLTHYPELVVMQYM